jgi:hypothetical protein
MGKIVKLFKKQEETKMMRGKDKIMGHLLQGCLPKEE